MGGAPSGADDAAAAYAHASEPRCQIAQQRHLAPLKVRGAGDVDRHAIRWIGLTYRRISMHGPQSETIQGVGVAVWVGVFHVQAGDQRLGMGRRHADTRAACGGSGIASRYNPLATHPASEDEGLIRRRRVGAQSPAQPIDGPVWQEERDDPSHRKRPE